MIRDVEDYMILNVHLACYSFSHRRISKYQGRQFHTSSVSPFLPSLNDHCVLSSPSVTDVAFGLTGFAGAEGDKDGTIAAACLIGLGGAGEVKDGRDAAFGAGAGGKHGTTFPSST